MLIDNFPALVKLSACLWGSFGWFLISLSCLGSRVGFNCIIPWIEFPSLELDGAMRSFVNVHQASGSSSSLVTIIAQLLLFKPSCPFALKKCMEEKIWTSKTLIKIIPRFSLSLWAAKTNTFKNSSQNQN